MNGEQTFNVNSAECITSQNNWGESITHNICNGETYSVPWGTVDYGIGVFFAVLLAILLAFGIIILKDLFN